MANELDKPLRRKMRRRPDRKAIEQAVRNFPVARTAFGLLALIVLVVGFRVFFVQDPSGGRPAAEAGVSTTQDQDSAAPATAHATHSDATADTRKTPPPEAKGKPGQDATSGTGDAAATVSGPDGGPQITIVGNNVPDAGKSDAGTTPGSASAGTAAADLAETTRYGAIPRIADDGETPFAAYSRAPTGAAAADGQPRIAIVMTGMGLNRTGTLQAVKTLPPAVTLAFAPYGNSLKPTASAARRAGHELLLELPMEPFDYPQSDPGPKTLLVNQPARANLDRLFWLLARFRGYMGVMNYMGARFTASGSDFQPIIEELATRGLGYFDDGSSNRSLAPQMAEANKIPFVRGSLEIDASPSRGDILSALSDLEAEARDKGTAVGIASALPVSIDTIAEWAKGLDKKGLSLVPVSALMK